MENRIPRRTFLGTAAALAAAGLPNSLQAQAPAQSPTSAPAPGPVMPPADTIPVIDTHIHLFDPFRPGGVTYPSKNNPAHAVMYKTSLPDRYRPIVEPLGIVGAIEIECSGLLEDNQWVLDVAAKDEVMVGTIGHLTPVPRLPRQPRPLPQESPFPGHPLRPGPPARPRIRAALLCRRPQIHGR